MLTSVLEIAKLAKKIASTGFAMTCAPFEFCEGAFQSIQYPNELQILAQQQDTGALFINIRWKRPCAK